MGADNRMTKKDKAKSISKKLSNLAKKRDTPFRNIAMAFYLERLLARIVANKQIVKHIVFKGGYVGLRVYESQRYTIDLDAALIKKNISEALQIMTLAIESDIDDCTWFKLDSEKSLLTQGGYEGMRQIYRVGLGDMPADISNCDIVHFDIGVDDSIVPAPVNIKTEPMLAGESLSWNVYPMESIVAEKIHAFISRDGDSSRAKDIFDLAYYLPKTNSALLMQALESCFQHRHTELPESVYKVMRSYDFKLAKRGWMKVGSSLSQDKGFDFYLDVVLEGLKGKSI